MRHTASLSIMAIIATLFLAGCGDKRVTYVETELPEWVANPYADGQIGGMGSALPSRGGFSETLAEAEGKARTDLARSLSTNVRAALTHFFSEGGQIYGDRADDPRKNEMVEHADRLFENLGRHINNNMLEMTHRKKIWTHPETKEMFVWVVVAADHRDGVLRNAQHMAREHLRRAKISAELKSQEALDRLDDEIERRMNASLPQVAAAAQAQETPVKN